MIKTEPIKRSPALVQFSRDHHFSLLLVWKIRQGLQFGIEPQRISSYINFFFKNYLVEHFKQEEELLFEHLDNNNELRKITQEDHTALIEYAKEIEKNSKGTTLLTDFADRLEKHIRFEERQLFNELQNKLDESELNIIAVKMEELHLSKKEDDWKDLFWMKNKNYSE
ncbi:MAG: hemerythrin domain-containing protein [Ginsengibacter sp.]